MTQSYSQLNVATYITMYGLCISQDHIIHMAKVCAITCVQDFNVFQLDSALIDFIAIVT